MECHFVFITYQVVIISIDIIVRSGRTCSQIMKLTVQGYVLSSYCCIFEIFCRVTVMASNSDQAGVTCLTFLHIELKKSPQKLQSRKKNNIGITTQHITIYFCSVHIQCTSANVRRMRFRPIHVLGCSPVIDVSLKLLLCVLKRN